MTRSFPLAAVVVVLGTTALSPAAIAQGQTWRLTCSNHGNAVPEPLGDRPGHEVALASGKAVALAGKAFTWTGRTTGPGVYTVDVTMP